MVEMKFENRIFNNAGLIEQPQNKYAESNVDKFFANMTIVLNGWEKYLRSYTEKTADLFASKPEFPWAKFDEPTWVSSLALAIARTNPEAILVEELPANKGKNTTGKGNVDLWCHLGAETNFSFYLEAKASPWARNIVKKKTLDSGYSLEKLGKEMASADKHGLFSQAFRDDQKSLGEERPINSTESPHHAEADRMHPHVFLTLIIRPMCWDNSSWPTEEGLFKELFKPEPINIHLGKSVVKTSLYNIPIAGIVMRAKTNSTNSANSTGFIALVMMLGESDGKKEQLR